MSELTVLSVRQPWASLLTTGEDWCENRSWSTKYRGKLWIHASSKVVRDECELWEIDRQQLTTSAIVGCVDLVDVIDFDADPKAFRKEQKKLAEKYKLNMEHGPEFVVGPYCWIFANPRELKEPIPAKGKLNLWKFAVPDDWKPQFRRKRKLIPKELDKQPRTQSRKKESTDSYGPRPSMMPRHGKDTETHYEYVRVKGKKVCITFSVSKSGITMMLPNAPGTRVPHPETAWQYKKGPPVYRAACRSAWKLFPEHFPKQAKKRSRKK